MDKTIRRATHADLPRIHAIYSQAREFMAANGNPHQWTNGYPGESAVLADLSAGNLYVCVDRDEILGVFCFFQGVEPDYLHIHGGTWLQDGPYGVVHRIASAVSSRGVASACLEFAYSQCGNLRIDTHRDNIPMQRLLAKHGFHYCGIIHLEKNGSERLAYQKI